MAKSTALSYLWATLTQGSADAFVQASMATGLSGQTRLGYKIREVLIEAAGTSGAAVVNLGVYEIALTRKSQAAMPNITDKSVIAKFKYTTGLVTSGAFIADTARRWTFSEDDSLVIVEDPVYWQLDTNATTAANTFYVRLGYQQVNLNEIDRLTLIANSLQ